MITKDTLEEFFDMVRKMRDSGEADFDVDGVCRWSYFFIDADRDKLIDVGRYLERNGYEIIGFLEPSPDDDDQETIYLRADRVEHHTLETLHERNQELYRVAQRFGVTDYDGMDVGDVDGP